MKRTLAVVGVACLMAVGCATMNNGDGVRVATLKAIGAEQIAWGNQSTRPAGMESVVALTNMNAHVDTITVDSENSASALATYKYTGRFATDSGERTGVLTVQRKLRFTKSGAEWTQSGSEEIARSSDWAGPASAKQAVK